MFRRMDSELRIAMLQAVEERRELDHELLGPDHFLLGLLSNVRGSAYKVLAEQGVTYEWARRVVVEKHDDTASSAPARDRQDAADNLEEDREALRAIGIDLDKVRDAVRETFGEDITDGWGSAGDAGSTAVIADVGHADRIRAAGSCRAWRTRVSPAPTAKGTRTNRKVSTRDSGRSARARSARWFRAGWFRAGRSRPSRTTQPTVHPGDPEHAPGAARDAAGDAGVARVRAVG